MYLLCVSFHSNPPFCARSQVVLSELAIDVVQVQVVLYVLVRRGVPVKKDTYPESSACEL